MSDLVQQLDQDRLWLRAAVDLSRLCPASDTAYAVGAVVVDQAGRELARGWSRELDPYGHAEEVAVARLGTEANLSGAIMYSSLEPCSRRSSRSATCTQLILGSGIRRVVIAMREPPVFVLCDGVRLLREAGIEVVELPELADQVRAINAHLL